jgi:pimeloyl-ACP methyl ester carboxylesterase
MSSRLLNEFLFRLALSSMATCALATPATIKVGSLELQPCANVAAYCGHFQRALDPLGREPGSVSIYFEFYPHTGSGRSTGTLVATEGGPGYPATLTRKEYLALFAPLRESRDVVLMDNRGTGKSGAIDCRPLQTGDHWTIETVADCGRFLAARAPLYSTAYAADDLAAILTALDAFPIDLYGDSYGTYFEQVFALRHPKALRSIVLDGAYPLDGPDYPWYPTYAPAMRAKYNLACARSAACASLPGDSIAHIAPVIGRLRAAPFAASGNDLNGNARAFTADAAKLATVMFASAPAFATVREVDAAARAFLAEDRAPLLRLMAETSSAVDSRDPTANAEQWSAGLAAAVMCQDPPQIFDMHLAPEARRADRDRVIEQRLRKFPDTYAPFSIDEYRGMPLDYSFIDQCVGWPAIPLGDAARKVVPADAVYPDIPALVISGELDNMTTMADGAAVAKAFKHGQQLIFANSLHVDALPHARSECGAIVVRRFIENLSPGDTQCAQQIPPVRLVPAFALHAADADAAAALPGNTASTEQLRWVAAAVLTVGDVLARLRDNSSGHGTGLRGGRYQIHAAQGSERVIMEEVRWSSDLAVSGSVQSPRRSTGTVRADVRFPQAGGGRLAIRWDEGAARPMAHIEGRIGGASVVAQADAP